MNLAPVYPEIFLLIATSAILLIDMFLTDAKRHITFVLTLLVLVVCGVLSAAQFGEARVLTFHGMFVSDSLSSLLKIFCYLSVGVTLIYTRKYATDRGMVSGGIIGGEFYALSLFSLLGQMVMISASSMLSIYLGLELMTLSLYALVALRRGHTVSTEAAMKYFVLGAMASGFLLYGISMLYGATGSLNLADVAQAAASDTANKTILVFGLVFVVAGLAFKLSAAPFHMWVPDVYTGAPTGVTLLIASGPKLAAFAITFRLLAEALPAMAADWQQMLLILAVLSMAIGNITAIVQTNIKRVLAYSTIAQIGFMLLGFIAGNGNDAAAANGYSSAMFYALTYVLTTLGTFGVIMLLARAGFEAENLEDFRGLNQRSPWFAFVMLILMFSLTGIPPAVGFYAKLAVLQAVLSTGQVWLAVVAVLLSLIGAFYYLRVVKVMYFDEPADDSKLAATGDMRVTLGVNGIAVLALGILPGPLMALCDIAIRQSLKLV